MRLSRNWRDGECLAEKKEIIIALAGNPNSGKTTIFNALTGERAHTGNWPGVTVARREGKREYKGYVIKIVDLPGTYSLTSGTPEEVVARNYIINDNPDFVVNIVDASNLERNLVLTSELIELGAHIIVCLNMWDEVEKKGFKIDVKLISQLLAAPCVSTIAPKGAGVNELLDGIIEAAGRGEDHRHISVGYGHIIEGYISEIEAEVCKLQKLSEMYPPRWFSIKLLEEDAEISKVVDSLGDDASRLKEVARKGREEIERKLHESAVIAIPDHRYGFVAGIFREAVLLPAGERRDFSDQADRVIMSRAFGLPIFIVIMWLTFQLTFTGGTPLMNLIDMGFGALGHWMGSVLPPGPINSLVVDGIIAGVGGVIIFLPNILILFLIISFLEEWGYMARAAFVMDGLMHKIGLHGKSFVPLVMGFGCTVPAIMATRTLETRRDRLVTMAIAPLMSCGARLPVYTLLIGAFFSERIAGNILFLIYVIGVLLAIAVALIFRHTLFRGETTPFVMELPPYRWPTFAAVGGVTWERGYSYLKKAGTVILAASVIVWFLSNYPYNPENDTQWSEKQAAASDSLDNEITRLNKEYPSVLIPGDVKDIASQISDEDNAFDRKAAGLDENSVAYIAAMEEHKDKLLEIEVKYPNLYPAAFAYHLALSDYTASLETVENEKARAKLANSFAGHIGRAIEPVLRPCGFDWRIDIALVTGLAAKEVVVSSMGTIYALGQADEKSGALKTALRNDPAFSPLVAFCMMIFILVYSPCLASIAVQKSESGSWRWALFVMGYLTVLAWICSMIIFQAGRALGIGM